MIKYQFILIHYFKERFDNCVVLIVYFNIFLIDARIFTITWCKLYIKFFHFELVCGYLYPTCNFLDIFWFCIKCLADSFKSFQYVLKRKPLSTFVDKYDEKLLSWDISCKIESIDQWSLYVSIVFRTLIFFM